MCKEMIESIYNNKKYAWLNNQKKKRNPNAYQPLFEKMDLYLHLMFITPLILIFILGNITCLTSLLTVSLFSFYFTQIRNIKSNPAENENKYGRAMSCYGLYFIKFMIFISFLQIFSCLPK